MPVEDIWQLRKRDTFSGDLRLGSEELDDAEFGFHVVFSERFVQKQVADLLPGCNILL
jgi:hypothetical protein